MLFHTIVASLLFTSWWAEDVVPNDCREATHHAFSVACLTPPPGPSPPRHNVAQTPLYARVTALFSPRCTTVGRRIWSRNDPSASSSAVCGSHWVQHTISFLQRAFAGSSAQRAWCCVSKALIARTTNVPTMSEGTCTYDLVCSTCPQGLNNDVTQRV